MPERPKIRARERKHKKGKEESAKIWLFNGKSLGPLPFEGSRKGREERQKGKGEGKECRSLASSSVIEGGSGGMAKIREGGGEKTITFNPGRDSTWSKRSFHWENQ